MLLKTMLAIRTLTLLVALLVQFIAQWTMVHQSNMVLQTTLAIRTA